MVSRRTEGNGGTVHSSLTKLAASSEPGCLSFVRRYAVAFSLFVGMLVLVILTQGQKGRDTSNEISLDDQVRKRPKEILIHAGVPRVPKCSTICDARQVQYNQTWGGNLLDRSYLVQTATQAEKKLHKQLTMHYGTDFFEKLQETSQGALKSGDADQDLSTNRFRRKLLLKILEVQISLERQERDVRGCDCTKRKTDESHRQLAELEESSLKLPPLPASYGRFVWSTGGHSAAAGHGNLFNETYTAVLERSASSVFSSLGLEMEARNAAMGGTMGAPEIALCSESIFGTDVDVLSWDYGMMESGVGWKFDFFGNRVGIQNSRPAWVGLRLGDRGRRDTLKRLEEDGLTALWLDDAVLDTLKTAVPDMFGMTTEEMEAIPLFLRHYKCNDVLEKGDPTCDDQKYSNDTCPEREHKAPWHPGWKDHALTGNIIGLYLTDMVVEAVNELAASNETSDDLLAKLTAQEDADYDKFFQSMVADPERASDTHRSFYSEQLLQDFETKKLFRSRSICKTARLPSQSRYRGILSEEMDGSSMDNFNNGITREQADVVNPEEVDKGVMPLVAADDPHKDECSVRTKMDRKDYFFNKNGYGWKTLTIPNAAERREYVRDSWNPQGIVIVCWGRCDWGECSEGELRWEAAYNGTLKMELNGQAVVNFTAWETKDGECYLLRGKQGYLWKANDANQYELRTKVEGAKNSFTRISSFVVM